MRSKALVRAQKKYDSTKRPTGVFVRFDENELPLLDALRKEGESRAAAVKRLVGFAP